MTARGVRDRLGQAFARTPRWGRLLLAIVTLLLGTVILLRPTTSLGVLALLIGAGLVAHGISELVDTGPAPHSATGSATGSRAAAPGWRPVRLLVAALWVVAGLVVLVLPGLTVRVLAVVVGVGLLVNGLVLAGAAVRRGARLDERLADGAFGLAGIVFGLLALLWPDITLIVTAVVFGARLIMSGVSLGWVTLRGRRGSASQTTQRPRWGRAVVAIAVVALAAGSALVSATIRDGSPVVDDFYAAPRTVPDEPGHLVRAEPFTRGVPESGRAWRILYTTSRGDGSPTVASGIVVVPAQGPGDWPVIDWNHGTTGVAQNCAPSLAAEPFESGALMILPEVLDEGWALVATDYIGLGAEGPHPYLIGTDSAHASLDAVRAARRLTEADLGEQTVVWGHSQGGGAALWTDALAEVYAPELTLDGVAALAPASDLTGFVGSLADITGGSVFAAFVAEAYTAEYDDVAFRDYIRPGAQVTVRQMAQRCLAPPGVIVSGLTALALTRDPDVLAADPTTGPFGARLEQNEPPAAGSAPLLVGQGLADSIITAEVQREYVAQLCEAGRVVDYRTYEDLDHLALVAPDSPLVPELISWTRERFDGEAAPTDCRTS